MTYFPSWVWKSKESAIKGAAYVQRDTDPIAEFS